MTDSIDTQGSLYSESEVSIDVATIITGLGNKFSLRYQLVEMNIYDDIFSNCISATIVIDDTYNMIGNLPIVGQEDFYFRAGKPGSLTDKNVAANIEGLWRVYKIEKVIPANERKQIYMMHMVGEDMVESNKSRVHKSYKNTNPENAIKDILKNDFGYDDSDIAKFNIENSKEGYNFVVPNLRTFDAINWIASKARNNQNMSDYLFFENNDGYNFRSLSSIFTDDPVATMTIQNKNIVTSTDDTFNSVSYLFSPISHEVRVLFDYINSVRSGEYGVDTKTFDISRQQLIEKPIQYDLFLDKYKKIADSVKSYSLNKYGKVPSTDYDEIPLSTNPNNKDVGAVKIFSVLPTIDGSLITNNEAEIIATRLMQFSSITDQNIVMHFPGNPILICGKTVLLRYPSVESRSDEVNQVDFDKYLDAKYLIVSTRHKITQQGWDTFVSLSKDTLPNKIPDHQLKNYDISELTSPAKA